ncbi:hypothetical protein QBC45DRAFT_456747 [Copromyces sp. CBS 386.78]|nr:hypothetical protein QBC45DRAFT_456747 [Copromyces sp. CBS 386.78]
MIIQLYWHLIATGAPLQRLNDVDREAVFPIELLERIFEFVGDIAYVSEGDPVDLPDDETLEASRSPLSSRPHALRLSSLVVTGIQSVHGTGTTCSLQGQQDAQLNTLGLFCLLRSLLECPANRKYVQWLVTPPLRREYYLDHDGIRGYPPDIVDPKFLAYSYQPDGDTSLTLS